MAESRAGLDANEWGDGCNVPARLVTYLSYDRKAPEAVPADPGANYLSLDRYRGPLAIQGQP